jgi:hypothetical protein
MVVINNINITQSSGSFTTYKRIVFQNKPVRQQCIFRCIINTDPRRCFYLGSFWFTTIIHNKYFVFVQCQTGMVPNAFETLPGPRVKV